MRWVLHRSGCLSLTRPKELTRSIFRPKTISHPVQNSVCLGGPQQHVWSLLCIVGARVRIDSPLFLTESNNNRFFPATYYRIPGLLLNP